VAEARRFYRERRHITQPEPPPIDTVRALTAEGPHGPIPLRLYRHGEGSSQRPVLVYFHGGGWVIGDLDTHDTLCRQLALASGCVVVSVDYRMGPEHPFPAAVDDACAATRWVAAQAAALGLDATRLAVGGDSAGGNLAAVVSLALRGELPLAFQLLIYPATDQHRTHESHRRNAQGYLLTADTMTWFHDHYITDPAHDDDWRASPLRHPDLSRLPPALVLTAGYDPLRDEGMAYAQRLSESGVWATLVSFERQIHGFMPMGRVIDEANEAVALCADALKRALKA
jgi:acetyl esterase